MEHTETTHLPYLDGWRGLAITFLLVGHFFPVPGINLGVVGVHLFFVLSGLLMARILFIKHAHLPTFYRRRIARIVPSAAVYIMAVVLWCFASGREIDWRQVAAAATFTNNYFQSPESTIPLGHIWSLSVEEHSYVALSLLAVLTRLGMARAQHAVGAAAILTAACAYAYWALLPGVRTSAFNMHSEVAAFGIFASAFLAISLGRWRPWRPAFVVPALLAAGLAAHWWSVPAALKVTIGCAALAAAVNLLDRAPRAVHAVLNTAALRKLGTWSFSLYLWQQPFYLMVHQQGMAPAAGLAVSVAAGIAAYYAIERPARRYLNRAWPGRQPAPAGQPESEARRAPLA